MRVRFGSCTARSIRFDVRIYQQMTCASLAVTAGICGLPLTTTWWARIGQVGAARGDEGDSKDQSQPTLGR